MLFACGTEVPFWAEFNVGATIESYRNQSIPSINNDTPITSVSAEDTTQLYRTTGNYFCWGSLVQYIDGTSDDSGNVPADDPYLGDENPLPDANDVAMQKWGSNWRIPTKDQLEDLLNTVIVIGGRT